MVNRCFSKKISQGFTLIELLIVIVLIGILSVVLISVIDPEHKVRLASDGVLMATVNKLVLSTDSFVSAYNRVPNESEFMHTLDINRNVFFGVECTYNLTPNFECLFHVENIRFPQTCDLSHWTGEGSNEQPCSFRYQGMIMDDPRRFRIYIKSHGLPNRVFAYDNKEGGQVFDCPYTITDFNPLADFCNSH